MGNWDFQHKAVQQYDNPESSAQLGSKAVLISFGPPYHNQNAKTVVSGFVQNLNMNQQKQIQEIFEIGSQRRYWADNPTRNNMSINRALFSGPSLLKVAGMGLLNRGMNADDLEGVSDHLFKGGDLNAAGSGKDKNFWINLGSDLFKNPLGIMLEFREFYGNGKSDAYGSVYLTNAKISGHSLNMQAGRWMMQESMQLRFERAVPLSKGSTVKDHYAKRKEIMEDTHNMTPEWFENYADWDGERSEPKDGTTA